VDNIRLDHADKPAAVASARNKSEPFFPGAGIDAGKREKSAKGKCGDSEGGGMPAYPQKRAQLLMSTAAVQRYAWSGIRSGQNNQKFVIPGERRSREGRGPRWCNATACGDVA